MTSDKNLLGYSFNVLHDRAASADLFGDKTHENVAANLHRLVSSGDEGITIGLEGSWGAGKSTVLKLFHEKLKEGGREKSLFFMFDAWAHEGDPLRRIFLESLVKNIDPDGREEELQRISREISGSSKKIEVSATKSTSRLGKLLSLSALLIPIGAALLSKLTPSHLVPPWHPEADLAIAMYISLAIALAPFWVLGYWFLRGDKKNGKRDWEIFTTESTERYTQDIIEDGERTTIEFEVFFKKIIDFAVKNAGYSKAIIVVDNLDRVDHSQAKNIWSTLQTFFQYRSSYSVQDNFISNIWFVIPYDRDGFNSIWGESGRTSSSFLEKCFQVKVEVPLPVMSGWIGYLRKCVDVALAGWPSAERESVFDAFQKFYSKLESSPTPRKIRSAINQIGINGMRWGGIMSPQAICLYSIWRLEASENSLREALLKNEIPYALDEEDRDEIKMELAGMLFGVPKERGFELLLGPVIEADLYSGDGALIKLLIEEHRDAFWVVWRSIRQRILPTSSNTEESRIAFTLAFAEGMKDSRDRVRLDVGRLSSLWQSSTDGWELEKYEYASALEALIDLSVNKDLLADWICRTTNSHLERLIGSLFAAPLTEEKVRSIWNLRQVVIGSGKSIPEQSYPVLDKDEWSRWVSLIDGASLEFNEVLPAKGAVSGLSSKTFEKVNPLEKPSLELLIRTLPLTPKSGEWEDVAKQLSSWLTNNQREMNVPSAYELAAKIITYCGQSPANFIEEAIGKKEFWDIANQENSSGFDHLACFAALAFVDDLQTTSHVKPEIKEFWSTEKEPDDLKKIYSYFSKLGRVEDFWAIARDSRNVVSVQIIRSFVNEELYSKADGIRFIDEYSWAEEEEIKRITEMLCKLGGSKAAFEELESDPKLYHGCIQLLAKFGDALTISKIQEILNALSKDDWIDALRSDSRLLKCSDKTNHKYGDALQLFVTSTFSSASASDTFWDDFEYLVGKAPDRKRLLEKLAVSFFVISEDVLGAHAIKNLLPLLAPFIAHVDAKSINEKLMVWLDRGDWSSISWLLSVDLPRVQEPMESLVSRVYEKLASTENEEELEILKRISAAFNIPSRSSGRERSE